MKLYSSPAEAIEDACSEEWSLRDWIVILSVLAVGIVVVAVLQAFL